MNTWPVCNGTVVVVGLSALYASKTVFVLLSLLLNQEKPNMSTRSGNKRKTNIRNGSDGRGEKLLRTATDARKAQKDLEAELQAAYQEKMKASQLAREPAADVSTVDDSGEKTEEDKDDGATEETNATPPETHEDENGSESAGTNNEENSITGVPTVISPEQDFRNSQQESGHMLSWDLLMSQLETCMRTEVFPKIKYFKKGVHLEERLLRDIIEKRMSNYVANAGENFDASYPTLRSGAARSIRTKRATVTSAVQEVIQSKC